MRQGAEVCNWDYFVTIKGITLPMKLLENGLVLLNIYHKLKQSVTKDDKLRQEIKQSHRKC